MHFFTVLIASLACTQVRATLPTAEQMHWFTDCQHTIKFKDFDPKHCTSYGMLADLKTYRCIKKESSKSCVQGEEMPRQPVRDYLATLPTLAVQTCAKLNINTCNGKQGESYLTIFPLEPNTKSTPIRLCSLCAMNGQCEPTGQIVHCGSNHK
jgi:hypothetical protein